MQGIKIKCATEQDIPQVKELLERYHSKNLIGESRSNGFVTTDMTIAELQALTHQEQGVTIAIDTSSGVVVGVLIGASWDFLKPWPMFDYMQGVLGDYFFQGECLSKQTSYQYGPICIAEEYRSKGIGEKLLEYQRRLFAECFPLAVTFVNRVNPRSYAFHIRAGFVDVGQFQFNSNHYQMLGCVP
ncbi:GNAT family N-acetyltransferase [Serratia microhaemolytica]|uniref:GNAT family N-acetyltransferase n=1 Tax=Serratia microhaemolytica TaxID=2675110 RepID=UPI000FDF544E|nr:GNAT family N-acetyltransferase [Serratia microhaemolytica]